MTATLNNLSQDKLYFNAFHSTNVRTDALIISSHNDPSLKYYSSLKRTKKLGKKKKHLRMKQNFEQCSGRLSTAARTGT